MLKGGSDVDFFAAFGEPIQNHVYEDIGSGATDSVAAVHNCQKKIRQINAGQSNKYDTCYKDVNFFVAFGEPIQNHVYEDIGSGATHSVAAVHN